MGFIRFRGIGVDCLLVLLSRGSGMLLLRRIGVLLWGFRGVVRGVGGLGISWREPFLFAVCGTVSTVCLWPR